MTVAPPPGMGLAAGVPTVEGGGVVIIMPPPPAAIIITGCCPGGTGAIAAGIIVRMSNGNCLLR